MYGDREFSNDDNGITLLHTVQPCLLPCRRLQATVGDPQAGESPDEGEVLLGGSPDEGLPAGSTPAEVERVQIDERDWPPANALDQAVGFNVDAPLTHSALTPILSDC